MQATKYVIVLFTNTTFLPGQSRYRNLPTVGLHWYGLGRCIDGKREQCGLGSTPTLVLGKDT